VHAGDRHPQHAAGCARRRHDRLLHARTLRERRPRCPRRVRRDAEDLYATQRQAHRGLRHGPLRLGPHRFRRKGKGTVASEMRITFQEELEQVEAALQEEGDYVLRALRAAVNALEQADSELADEVIAFDDEIDRRYFSIQEGIQSLLARQTPVAVDLRLVLAMLHANLHLERMGDYCVTIAKLTKLVSDVEQDDGLVQAFEEMGQRAEQMIR